METIRVHSDFHAAHRQLGYDGKCRYVHGHTWIGHFTVRAQQFPRNELDMSVDFGHLKDIFRFLDHKMMISSDDETFLKSGLFEPDGVVVIPGTNPSVENVALYCLDRAVDLLRSHYPDRGIVYEIEVTVQETDRNVFSMDRKVKI